MINDEGFLSVEIDATVKENEATFKLYVDFFKKINVFCQKTLFEIKVDSSKLHHWCLAVLFLRALSTFQAVFLLVIRGLTAEAKILLRTSMEIQYITIAIEKNNLIARDYLGQEAVEMQKILKKAKEYPHAIEGIFNINEVEEKIKFYEDEKSKYRIKPKSIKQFAESAGLIESYDTYYKFLCLTSHTNMADAREHLVFNEKGEATTFNWGPQKNQMIEVLLASIETILKTTESLSKSFCLHKENEYELLNNEFKEVHNSLHIL